MTEAHCDEMSLLLQADQDGELDAEAAAKVAAHVQSCAACRKTQGQLAGLSRSLRTGMRRHTAPESLRHRVLTDLMPEAAPVAIAEPEATWRAWFGGRLYRHSPAWPFGAGFATAAALALVLSLSIMPEISPTSGMPAMAGKVVAGHIRALQPGHLVDVDSTDRHTVKPWFDGRLDYAPPVKDLAAQGFPLTGGRLDFLGDRPVAAMAYRRAQHVIDLFVWPSDRPAAGPMSTDPMLEGEENGYAYVHWRQAGMDLWAVSDIEAHELGAFVRLWRAD